MLNESMLDAFFSGHSLEAYKIFGAHFCYEKCNGVRFTLHAPNARSVQIIGTFNGWNGQNHYLTPTGKYGVFSIFIPNVKEWDMYKYVIEDQFGNYKEKSDPYAFYSELRPKTTSVVVNLDQYRWEDQLWMSNRKKDFSKPMNIYEVHLGSWRLENGEFLTYEELAKQLVGYCKENGYTHIEMMPVSEHPFDGSWGYQTSGYYSCTSRYGSPYQLMYFIEECHHNGIGVIMDFVPVHFVKDEFGLSYFDGTPLYEYADEENAFSEWGTKNFDLWKEDVRSFLMSSVAFWIEKYHIDGIRVDAVSNMIYWSGNATRGVNEGAISFIKRMNHNLNKQYPSVYLIAEDSSSYPNVTKSVLEDGLGFDYKWDLGWMNDTLKYLETDFMYRVHHHHDLTFSMAYNYSERFILPLSHDEVVHGKKSIIDKMFGSYTQKFAQAKLLYLYQYTHPGKKLNFMGNEIGHFREWDELKEMDWFLLNYDTHHTFARYMKDLSHVYKAHSALYRYDHSYKGFRWIDADNMKDSIYSYYREDERSIMVVVLNMSNESYETYDIGVPIDGVYTEIINTEKDIYHGCNMCNYTPIQAQKASIHNLSYKLTTRIAPLSGILFEVMK